VGTMTRIGRATRLTLMTLALTIGFGGSVWAEKSSSLIGKKIRLFVPSMGAKPISGRLTRLNQDSAYLKVFRDGHPEVKEIPTAAIEGCDIRVRGKSYVALGVCLGTVVGAGMYAYQRNKEPRTASEPDRHGAFEMVMYFGGGGVIGGGVGAMIRLGVWRPASIWDDRTPPQSGAVTIRGLTLALHF
jgi:hypothetical protein